MSNLNLSGLFTVTSCYHGNSQLYHVVMVTRLMYTTVCVNTTELHGEANVLLFQLRFFHVCNGGLLPGIMHDILEGALQYEVKLMLKVMVTEKRFIIIHLNGAMKALYKVKKTEKTNRGTRAKRGK